MRDVWVQRRRNSFLIPSPAENEKKLRAERFFQEGVRAGLKAAAIAAVVSAVPTFVRSLGQGQTSTILLKLLSSVEEQEGLAKTYVNKRERTRKSAPTSKKD
ncbi:uncharacterized protein LOC111302958 isoform X3 [Durio zibethinus]|uniref:Uncharacterized protein LOC111302958 isoform X3 n=1 Tax=Durio zibethinus TaxID=66656 RepID=A0A6P5ZQ03_DURZI|nr:uncharacterized protein LOC111302958 isoform X3 [Durio zibethinus]